MGDDDDIGRVRLQRIKLVKHASGQALINKKKAHEARVTAYERGLIPLEKLKEEDILEIQHHHLIQCLEKVTERDLLDHEVANTDTEKDLLTSLSIEDESFNAFWKNKLWNCCTSQCCRRHNYHSKSKSNFSKKTVRFNSDEVKAYHMNRQKRRHDTSMVGEESM
uniref:Potassium channel voltage dependent Kv4 C-terminal domain-containing protein n=1 Tax=Romanomermis culicivorax TaxID=13658 RepID=A0A915KGR9_ROMCU